jgi:hypothetical protein
MNHDKFTSKEGTLYKRNLQLVSAFWCWFISKRTADIFNFILYGTDGKQKTLHELPKYEETYHKWNIIQDTDKSKYNEMWFMIESGRSQHTFTPSEGEGDIHVMDIIKEWKQI